MKTASAPGDPSLGPVPAGEELLPAGQRRLLSLLQSLAGPATLTELADASGLHPNTLRGHLAGLMDRGSVVRTSGPADGPGRPAHRYAVTGPGPAPVAELTGLAVALSGAIARSSRHPADDARRAGRAWGHRLASESPTPPEPLPVLGRMGFAPEPHPDDRDLVRLTRCPLLEAARESPDIVCGVHRGLVEGLLEHAGASTEGVDLEPFAEVGACLLRLPGRAR